MDRLLTGLLSAVLLGRSRPLAPHNAAAIREFLGEKTDEDLLFFIQNGRWRDTVPRTMGEYDLWMKPCEKCGFDSAKISEKSAWKCWKCGGRLTRDFSDRALKVNSIRNR